jgi:hypothetical protein
VELLADDLDLERATGGGCVRDVGDAGELDENERGDCEEDEDRPDRPRQLEPVRAVDLRAIEVAWASPPPVADDEDDEQRLDEQEDGQRECADEPLAGRDPFRVRRRGGRWGEPAVPGESGARQGEQRSEHA